MTEQTVREFTPEKSTGTAEPAKLQYWPASHDVQAPDNWPDSYEFETLEDAVAFAMTQEPGGRDIAWLRTPEGEILKADQIRRLWNCVRRAEGGAKNNTAGASLPLQAF